MKMDKVAGSGNDEFYTPAYAVRPIIKYLRANTTIWLPFDTADSQYTKILKEHGFNIIHTHIKDGIDFFLCSVPECDYIISNPPYSKKTEVLDRLFKIGKPFAMLVGVVGLFESKKRFDIFKNNSFEILYFNKRVSFCKAYSEMKPSLNPPFSSVYICHNVLPKQICFDTIEKNATN